MEITLEAVEKVMEQTGVDYKAAKEALLAAEGDVDAAVKSIHPETKEEEKKIESTMDKLKKLVAEGNAEKIQIRKGDDILLSVPVNVGLVGGLIGIAAAPWALIAGTIAAYGFGCKLEVIRKDGTKDEVE